MDRSSLGRRQAFPVKAKANARNVAFRKQPFISG